MKGQYCIITLATLLAVVASAQIGTMNFWEPKEKLCKENVGKVGLQKMKASAAELHVCFNTLNEQSYTNIDHLCSELNVKLGCLRNFTVSAFHCMSDAEKARAHTLESTFNLFKDFICRHEKKALQSMMAAGELRCVSRKANEIMSCGRNDATRKMSLADIVTATFNHSQPHYVDDYCKYFKGSVDCIPRKLQQCSSRVQQLVAKGLAAMRRASPCDGSEMQIWKETQNAAPSSRAAIPPFVLLMLASSFYFAN